MQKPRLTREEAKQQTRRELLDAATRVFARRGFAAASVAEIAAEAGRTTGALYAHFATKEELFLELLAARQQHQAEALRSVVDGSGGVLDRIADLFASRQAGDSDWELLTFEFWLFTQRDDRARRGQTRRSRTARRGLGALIASIYRSDGTVPPLPPDELAALTLAVRDGLAMLRHSDPEAPVRDLFAYALARLTAPE